MISSITYSTKNTILNRHWLVILLLTSQKMVKLIKQPQRLSPLPFLCIHTCFKEMGSKFLCVTCGGNAQGDIFRGTGVEGGQPKYANCSTGEETPLVSKIAHEGKIHDVFTITMRLWVYVCWGKGHG